MSEVQDRDNIRFIRWQGITITQLGYTLNTLLLISTAIIGFCISKLLEGKCAFTCNVKQWIINGICLLWLNVLFILIASITRLLDFRYTAQTIINKNNETKINRLRSLTHALGKATWVFFGLSIALFFLGNILIAKGFLTSISQICQ